MASKRWLGRNPERGEAGPSPKRRLRDPEGADSDLEEFIGEDMKLYEWASEGQAVT